MSKEIIVRIMGQIIVDGSAYEPNQLVKNLTDIDELQKRGMVSTSAADIKYCQEVLNKSVIKHVAISIQSDAADTPNASNDEPAGDQVDGEVSKDDAADTPNASNDEPAGDQVDGEVSKDDAADTPNEPDDEPAGDQVDGEVSKDDAADTPDAPDDEPAGNAEDDADNKDDAADTPDAPEDKPVKKPKGKKK